MLGLFSSESLKPISNATDASCTSVSCILLSGSTTDASTWAPNFFGTASSEGGVEGGDSDVGVVVPGLVVPDEVPMSWSRLYSIPLTLANSLSSTIDISRLCSTMVEVIEEGLPGLSTPRRASREYVIPLTCSTRKSCTVPKWSIVPSAGLTCTIVSQTL